VSTFTACEKETSNENKEKEKILTHEDSLALGLKNTLIGEWVSVPGGEGNTYDLTYQFNSDGTGFYNSSGGVWAGFDYTTSGGYDAPGGSIYFRFVFVDSVYHSVWRSESSGSYIVFGDSLRLSDDGINTKLYTRKKIR
jgi:hypothetical protein